MRRGFDIASALPTTRILMALSIAVGLEVNSLPSYAQLRQGQPPVMDPPPPASIQVPNFATEFQSRYVAAGSPRIMLFWNIELVDRQSSDLVARDSQTITGSKNTVIQGQSIDNWGSRAATVSGNTQVQGQLQREIIVGERQDPKRTSTLSPVDSTKFQRAFEEELRSGGTRLVDRTMALRTTATEKEKAANNAKQVEAEAVRGKADLLLQVLFIADNQAPLGIGFDVSVRNVATGMVATSFYTKAFPARAPGQAGYVANNHGFQFQSSSESYSVEAVAIALADDVMNQLGPTLPKAAARSDGHK